MDSSLHDMGVLQQEVSVIKLGIGTTLLKEIDFSINMSKMPLNNPAE